MLVGGEAMVSNWEYGCGADAQQKDMDTRGECAVDVK